MADARIPLLILSGYLGAGKTTWLRHRLYENTAALPHVIVNEAADVPVDHRLLQAAASVTVLSGGCACCTGRAGLVHLLRDFAEQHSRGGFTGSIILETSGLCEPSAVVAAICDDPVVTHHVRVSEVTVIVDALHALSQLAEDPLGRRQIETADRLVIAKAEDADPKDLMRLVATLRHISPGATVAAARFGLPFALPESRGAAPADLGDGNGTALPLVTASLDLGGRVDWVALTLWLSALLAARGHEIVRIKGIVPTPAGRLLLQAVRRIVQSPEVLPDGELPQEPGALVFIGRGFAPEDIRRSYRYFCTAR